LKELYANRARMTLNTDADGGFAVELEIPFREESEVDGLQPQRTSRANA
jgi:hypothetical protein